MDMVEGLKLREKMERERMAWAICHIVNRAGFMKKSVTMRQILGEDKPEKKKGNEDHSRKGELEYLKAKFKE
jgi:hypothetical protein